MELQRLKYEVRSGLSVLHSWLQPWKFLSSKNAIWIDEYTKITQYFTTLEYFDFLCTLFTQTAFVPYLHHCYWYCLPAIQLQLCCGLYWKVECADEGKLLSSKLPWFAYQQNGLVKFDFPLSTCDSLISKKCQMWHVKVLLLDDKCVVVFSTEFLVSVSTLFLYTWKSFGYLSTFTVCFLQDEITNAFYHEGKKKQGSYLVLDDCWLYLTLKIGSLAAFVNNLYPYLSCSCQWFMYFAR